MPTIIAFGDSNTFGYNPATGGKYPDGSWVDHLHILTGWRTFNLGACGREIPHGDFEINSTVHQLVSLISSRGTDDQTVLYIMLGSNDLLEGYTAEETGQRMNEFITALQNKNPSDPICLIALVNFTPEGHRMFAEKLSVHHLPIHEVQ